MIINNMAIGFGKRLRSYRRSNDLTLQDMGKMLDVTFQCVSKWEKDESEPDIDTLKKLATIFNVTVDELIDFEHKERDDF